MLRITIAIVSIFTFLSVSKGWANYSCTDWKKVADRSCSFADKSSDYNGVRWERTCSYQTQCKNRDHEHGPCEAEKICLLKNQNPNEMTTPCTDWVPRHDVECIDGTKSWIRACQIAGNGYPDIACSNTYPQD
jgi:hypothetical protein